MKVSTDQTDVLYENFTFGGVFRSAEDVQNLQHKSKIQAISLLQVD